MQSVAHPEDYWSHAASAILSAGFGPLRHEIACTAYSDISGDAATAFQVFAYWIVDDIKLNSWLAENRTNFEARGVPQSWKHLRNQRDLDHARCLLDAAKAIGGRHAIFCFQSKLADMSFDSTGVARLYDQNILRHDWSGRHDRNRMDKACSCLSLALAHTASQFCDVTWKSDDDAILLDDFRRQDVVSVSSSFARLRKATVFTIEVLPKQRLSLIDRALLNIPDYLAGMWLQNLQSSPLAEPWLKGLSPSERTPAISRRVARYELVADWFDALDQVGERAVIAVLAENSNQLRICSVNGPPLPLSQK